MYEANRYYTKGEGLGFAASTAVASGSAGGPVGIAIAAAAVGIQIALQKLFSRKGPQQRIASTQIVNQVELILQENLAQWQGSYKTKEEQAKHLAAFDYAWQQMTQELSDSSLGNPGKVGITDRARGGQFDWFAAYRDPIANDETRTYEDAWSSYLGFDIANNSTWLLAGVALLGVGLWMTVKGD